MVLGYVFPVWYGDPVRTPEGPPTEPLVLASVLVAFIAFVVVAATVMERSHGRRPRRTPRSD